MKAQQADSCRIDYVEKDVLARSSTLEIKFLWVMPTQDFKSEISDTEHQPSTCTTHNIDKFSFQ